MVKSFQRLFAKKIIEACAEVNMQKKSGSKLNAILKYVSAAILLAVPLYPKFPLIAVSGTYVSVRLEDWLLLLTALTIFFSVGKVKNLFISPPFLLGMFFLKCDIFIKQNRLMSIKLLVRKLIQCRNLYSKIFL